MIPRYLGILLLLTASMGCGQKPGGRYVGDDYLVDQTLTKDEVLADPTQQEAVRASMRNQRR